MNSEDNVIEVVAAVIIKDGRVFATQRGYGQWKDWWEFPGGKVEAGESREQALRREIREELNTDIRVGRLLATVDAPPAPAQENVAVEQLSSTPAQGNLLVAQTASAITQENSTSKQKASPALRLFFYLCEVVSGSLELIEAEDARWLSPQELSSVRWLPNDRAFIDRALTDALNARTLRHDN